MSRLNSPLLSDIQSTSLQKKISTRLNVGDLCFTGNNCEEKENFEKWGVQANINRVLLWLASKDNDYIRESFKGGVLYNLLGQRSDDTDLSKWEQTIKERFNEDFIQDLELLFLKLYIDKKNRKLDINMIVRDRNKGETIPISQGVLL